MTHVAAPRLTRRSTVHLLVLALLASVLSVAAVTASPSPATAAPNGSNFDPGYIISDANFFDGDAMTVKQIQDFLDDKGPDNCNGCLREYRANTYQRDGNPNRCAGDIQAKSNITAAQMIYDVAQACDVSPRVLLVTLQKEMSLVTLASPASWRYQRAMGYACPDTAPCDSAYYGLFIQLYSAAGQLNWYSNPKSIFHWYPIGTSSSILYHPNSSCGTSKVTIKNRATAALYYYTPYQPNRAALNNLYGTGDSCSSYGNRNFWTFFYNWFGNPTGALASALEPAPAPTPTPEPSASPSASPTPEPSTTPSPEPTASPSATPSPSPTPAPEPSDEPEPAPEPEPEPSDDATPTYFKYRVKSGDTVWDLARRHNSTVRGIIDANDLNSRALIRVGQDLRIPIADSADTPAGGGTSGSGSSGSGGSTTEPPTSDPEPAPSTVKHRVTSGDTVWALARRYNSSVAAILKANDLDSRALIRPGQQLTIPGASGSPNSGSSSSGSSGSSSGGSSSPSATTHTVKSGDTVWDLARRYNSSVGAIITANDLNSRALIRPGQKLIIPSR